MKTLSFLTWQGAYRLPILLTCSLLPVMTNFALTSSLGAELETPLLIDVDFGSSNPGKVGLAATGRTTTDFWNFYSRDGAQGEWLTFGALANLKTVDGVVTPVGLTVANAPGAWGNGSVDVMYRDYIYPFDGGNVTVTITNLPMGTYDLYVYANDGNFKLVSGGTIQTRRTFESPITNPPDWVEGKQYALFSGITVTDGQFVLTVMPGQSGWAIISGMQLVKRLTPIQPPLPTTILIDVDFGSSNPGKVGLAATGRTTNDFWNFFSRDGAQGEWRTFGALTNLKTVEGAPTTVGLTVANAPGAWGNGSVDPMYRDYIYPFDGGNVTVTVTNLPLGTYDLYVYANDGNFTLVSGETALTRRTFEDPVVNPPAWTEGKQYALFGGVMVTNGQFVLTVMPGQWGYAIVSGMQLVKRVSTPPAQSLTFIDIDFGSSNPGKVGLAATGRTTNDFWNFYSRSDSQGEWRAFGALTNLKTVDGVLTSVGLTVANAPGMWGNGSIDPMYRDYIYPFDGGNVTVTITNLPMGTYDLYVYANDGNFRLVSGGATLTRRTFENPITNPPVWVEGKQYALFSGVTVTNGQFVLTVMPGQGGYAVISGMQFSRFRHLVPPRPPVPPRPTLTLNSATNTDLLRIDNASGRSAIVIYTSTNMIHWIPIHTNLPAAGPLDFIIPQGTKQPQRFYRTSEFE